MCPVPQKARDAHLIDLEGERVERPATDPRWQDLIPLHEYFHAETGMGLGASHQTGWTGLVANLIIER